MVDDLAVSLAPVAPARVANFTDAEHERWVFHAARLITDSNWEAARGGVLTDEMRLVVAANAAVLAAGFSTEVYPFVEVAAIVIHGGSFVTEPGRVRDADQVWVDPHPQRVAGLAVSGRGPVVLDWRTISFERSRPGFSNVVFHEFAHKLDFLNGDVPGMPPLSSPTEEQEWEQTMGTNYRRLRRRGSDGLISDYAATSPAEYFAVTTEVFFTRPDELRARLPRVYARLSSFYRQSP